MSRQSGIGKVATAVFTDADGMTKVIYHQTSVVAFDASRIILRHGGWRSATTKTRMNQAAREFALGYQVYQKSRQWYVHYEGVDHIFDGDSLTLARVSA